MFQSLSPRTMITRMPPPPDGGHAGAGAGAGPASTNRTTSLTQQPSL